MAQPTSADLLLSKQDPVCFEHLSFWDAAIKHP